MRRFTIITDRLDATLARFRRIDNATMAEMNRWSKVPGEGAPLVT